jgi:phosphoglycolate phosphatase-like HAD superfamily hydrolase
VDLMIAAGIAPGVIWARFAEFGAVMEADLRRRVAARLHNIRPCPGGPELISALASRPDVLIGLVTGNFRASALVKLEAAGYDASLFRIGAYGDEAEDRSDLPPLAVERASQIAGVSFHGPQVVMIGDTPGDIRCGEGIGARSIAVATGWTPRAELASHHPHYLFDDLSNTQAVLDAILAP